MSKKHIVKYKVSRQLKLALKALPDRILQKEYKVIESQDILFSLLDVQDTGIGYALGYYSLGDLPTTNIIEPILWGFLLITSPSFFRYTLKIR